jgi:hypothetical protein
MPQLKATLEDKVARGFTPRQDGNPEQRAAYALKKLTPAGVLQKANAWQVVVSLMLLLRHVPHTSPKDLLAIYLACYCIARLSSKRDGSMRQVDKFYFGAGLSVTQYHAVLHARNPLTENKYSLEDVVRGLQLHPVYKDSGDDQFYEDGKRWWQVQTAVPHDLGRQSSILLTALFFLAVRSKQVLAFLLEHPDFLLTDMERFSRLYEATVIQTGSPFIGLTPGVARGKHTTEQKLWGAGELLDCLLAPNWVAPAKLHDLLTADTPALYCTSLATFKKFGGTLVFSHTLEYLQLWDASSEEPLFKVRMGKGDMTDFVQNGKNATVYLALANATSQKGEKCKHVTMKALSQAVADLLPISVSFTDGSRGTFQEFEEVDGQQNSCKAVQCLQSHLTGHFLGKDRSKRAREDID